MACCCSCFKRTKKAPRRNVTLLLVGLDNAGKTTALKGIQGEPLDDVTPTIGFTYVDLQLDNFDIRVYDLGGGKKIRGIWKNYYAEVHGVIFVIDSSAEDRIAECQETLQMVLNQDYIKGKRVLILANKQDQEGALDEIDICEQLDLETMVNNSKCPCRVETCSAIQGSGKKVDKSLREGFRWLLRNILSEYDDIHVRVEKESAQRKEAEAEARKKRLERARKTREEREKREAEERKARGELEEVPEDEDVIDGDPFKKVDNKYFQDQEKKKTEKAKRKKEKNGAVVIGVDENRNKNVPADGQKPTDQTFINEGFEADEQRTGNSPRVVKNGDSATLHAEDTTPESNGRTEPDGSNTAIDGAQLGTENSISTDKVKKKKKGKKLKKKNKVGQMPLDGEDEVPAPSSPRPLTTPAWAAPPGQRSLLRASQRPALETLPEQHSPRSSMLPPIGGGANRGRALPEIRPTGARPNSEEDDGVVT